MQNMELTFREILSILIFLAQLISNCSEANRDPRLTCYYFSWKRYTVNPMAYFPHDIPTQLCDEIVYYRAELNETTYTIEPADKHADINEGDMLKVTDLASPKRKVMLAIGGYRKSLDGFSNLNSPTNREIFINSTVEFLKKYNFRGLVIDWIDPNNERSEISVNDKTTYVLLVKELRAIFKKLRYKLVITGPNDEESIDKGFNVPELSKYVDSIHVRSFNFWGWWETEAFSHNNLHPVAKNLKDTASVESIMALWESKGAPKFKLVVGVALEGVTSQLADEENGNLGSLTKGKGSVHKYSNYEGGILYYEACIFTMSGSWIEEWDEDGMVPYVHTVENTSDQGLKTKEWASYENPRSVTAKANFVKEKGYDGIFLYSINVDDFRGLCGPKNALTCAVKRVFSNETINNCRAER